MRKYSLGIIIFTFLCTGVSQARITFGGIIGGNYSTFLVGVDKGAVVNSTLHTGSLGPSGSFGYQVGGLMRIDDPTWTIDFNLLYTTRTMKLRGEITDSLGEMMRNYHAYLEAVRAW